ncbi:Na+/H+ antiporter subunit D [Tsukamurella pseudospumae]|uniref:Na+/H+ antiporter subunit D n=1 Tax=Tsukamurella pseudospumae TaxID=239498 RepID=UPI0009ED919B|nr:Na+/H+ antiporter subunit D [Tsukamurella pseudospumae]
MTDSTMHTLIPLPTVLPIMAAAITMVMGRYPRLQRAISLLSLSAIVVVAAAMLYYTDRHGTVALHIGGWGDRDGGGGPLGITLVADQLAALMVLVSAVVLLGVLVYSVGQGIRDGDEHQPVSIFYPTYLILAAGVCNAFLAGDLFNLFVSFEMLLAASFVLLTVGGSADRVRAGVSYVMVSMVSSLVFLLGIAYAYFATGTLNLADMAIKLQDLPSGTRTTLFAVLLVAFGIKAAVFPLSTWLPDSYPTAPAPVTAVFAGLLTKVGVYAIIRAHTLLFPGGSLDDVLMIAGLLTMIVGILGAIAQTDIKRLLSFTLVSHIGYMIFGIALSTPLGLSATIYYVVHHILVQTTLFLVVGLIERQAGAATLRRLGGLAAASPVLAILFFIPALNLGGIPPFSGFIGKVGLIEAGVMKGSVLAWVLVAGSVITSLLTLYAVARVWTKAFWRARADAPEGQLAGARPEALLDDADVIEFADREDPGRMPLSMVAPTAGLLAVGLFIALWAGPMFGITDRAADQLIGRADYIEAVLGPEALEKLKTPDGDAGWHAYEPLTVGQPDGAPTPGPQGGAHG